MKRTIDARQTDKVVELAEWYESERAHNGLLDMKLSIPKEAGIEDVASEVLAVIKNRDSGKFVRVKSDDDF